MTRSKKKLIAANWKTYLSDSGKVSSLIKSIISEITKADNLIIFPTFLHIREVASLLADSDMKIGAQDITHLENDVICTGGVTAAQLKDIGCKYVIIGHSERRDYYSETNNIVSKKVEIALSNSIIPIVCVGEPKSIKVQNRTIEFIKDQVLNSIPNNIDKSKIIIAYEPIWAIGTGVVPEIEDISSVLMSIKKMKGFENTTLLYGGSVNDKNIDSFAVIKELGGFLVGGASTDFEKLLSIYNSLN